MRATEFPAALENLAARLTAAGVPAETDPTRLAVPGAWVTVDTLNAELLCGDFTMTAAVYLLAKDNGHDAAVATLATMLDTLTEVMPAMTTAVPDSVAIPGHSGPLPALRITAPIGD